jgi:hypothetical protein
MALSAYEEFDEPPLEFPIGGKTYVLPEYSIPAGLKLSDIISGKDKDGEQLAGEALWRLLLGPLWDEMIADGVPLRAATRAGITALADYQYGREFAEATWEAGVDPKVLAAYMDQPTPNRAQRRSKSTAAATTTKPRASTSGTKTSPRS